MIPAEVIVGVDVGTTGVKAAASAPGGSWRRVAIREYALLHPAPDQQVQDPAAMVAAAEEALAECVAAADGADVLAISLSSAILGRLDDIEPVIAVQATGGALRS